MKKLSKFGEKTAGIFFSGYAWTSRLAHTTRKKRRRKPKATKDLNANVTPMRRPPMERVALEFDNQDLRRSQWNKN